MNDKELTFSEKEDIYYKIKNFKFRTEFYTRENRLDEVASWAVWNPSDLNDTKIIEKPESINKLKPNYVFVLLNFAGNGDVDFEDPAWKSWKNFHSNSRMDKRLFNVLKHPKYEGAYMTDIIKCVETKGEGGLRKKLNNKEINMETQVNIFTKEISILDKNNNIELFLLGRLTEEIYNNYMVEKIRNNIKATYIIHPSPEGIRNNTVFYEKIRSQLGINK